MIEIIIKPIKLSHIYRKFFSLIDIDISLTDRIELIQLQVTSHWVKFYLLNLDLGYMSRLNQLFSFYISRSEPNLIMISFSLFFFSFNKDIRIKHKGLYVKQKTKMGNLNMEYLKEKEIMDNV